VTWLSRAAIWSVCRGWSSALPLAPNCYAGNGLRTLGLHDKKAGPWVQRSASRKQPMTSRWVGRQESSEARGGAVRRSTPPGEGEGSNRQRQILASPLTPHRTRRFSLGSPRKTRPRQGRGRGDLPRGCGSNLQGSPGDARESTSNGGRPNKSTSREPRASGRDKSCSAARQAATQT